MPYLAILAALLLLGLPNGGPQAAVSAEGVSAQHMQLAYDDDKYGRQDGDDLDDNDQDDNAAPGDDDNYYDGDQGDSAHGAPNDDDDEGDDEDDGITA